MLTFETGECGGYHFCRAILDTGWDEEVRGDGVAKKSSRDRNDEYIGENLAMARALEIVARKLTKRTWGHVKHNDDTKAQRKNKKEVRAMERASIKPVRIKFPIFFRKGQIRP